MVEIFITRHGQNEDNEKGIVNGHRDRPLTQLGKSQAHQLAVEIKKRGITFDAVYASPLSRASETARIICDMLDLPAPEVLDLLIERDFGFMTGRHISDIPRLCPPHHILQADPITYFLAGEGVETFPQTKVRGRQALEFVQARHTSGSVLLVGHGDQGKMIYSAYHEMDCNDVLTGFHFGNCELVKLCKGTTLSESRIIQLNQHNH